MEAHGVVSRWRHNDYVITLFTFSTLLNLLLLIALVKTLEGQLRQPQTYNKSKTRKHYCKSVSMIPCYKTIYNEYFLPFTETLLLADELWNTTEKCKKMKNVGFNQIKLNGRIVIFLWNKSKLVSHYSYLPIRKIVFSLPNKNNVANTFSVILLCSY
jgi:hypothetical protein